MSEIDNFSKEDLLKRIIKLSTLEDKLTIDQSYVGFVLDALNLYLRFNSTTYYPHSSGDMSTLKCMSMYKDDDYHRIDGNTHKITVIKLTESTSGFLVIGLPSNFDYEKMQRELPKIYHEILRGRYVELKEKSKQ